MTPEHGSHKVLLKRGEFVDEARDGRVVPFKVYHPAPSQASGDGSSGESDAVCPLVVWSHGFGGNRDGAAFISRFLASHGYLLLHITHHGTDSSLWEGKEGHPWDILRKVSVTRETTLDRFKDVPFALNEFKAWAGEQAEISGHVDFDNIGMSGHSFGAMTTQVMAGQMFPDENGKLISLKEPRFKAGILYSPVPIRHLVGEEPEPHIYGPIGIPLLHMTGTDDDSPLEGHGYERRLVVHDYAENAEQYLQVLEDGDHMVYNGTRGKLAANDKREEHEAAIKAAVLAFWDAYLKGDGLSKEWLVKTYKRAN